MQLLPIRKAMPAATYAKTEPKFRSPRNKKLNLYSPSAAGKTSRQLPPSWHSATQLPEGAARGQAHTAASRLVPMEVQRPAEEKKHEKNSREGSLAHFRASLIQKWDLHNKA